MHIHGIIYMYTDTGKSLHRINSKSSAVVHQRMCVALKTTSNVEEFF